MALLNCGQCCRRLFCSLPFQGRVIHCVEEDIPEREEDSFAREDVRALANHQLEDFSDAFRRLSKSFENEMEEKGLSEERLEDIFAQLSRDTCNECINCKYCWNRHYEETNESLRQILWQVGQDGKCNDVTVSPDFQRRCMHLDEYVHQVEERIAGENVRLGWHNRMSENRRVMAEQMKEIAVALKSFTINLGRDRGTSQRAKTKNFRRIKKRGYQGSTFIGEKKGRISGSNVYRCLPWQSLFDKDRCCSGAVPCDRHYDVSGKRDKKCAFFHNGYDVFQTGHGV